MPVKMKLKSHSSGSNKTNEINVTKQSLELNLDEIAYKIDVGVDHNIYILKPKLDRLTLTVPHEPDGQVWEDQKAELKGALKDYIHDDEYSNWKKKAYQSTTSKKYEINFTLEDEVSGAEIRVHAIPTKSFPKFRCFRFEFMSSSLTPEGIGFFKDNCAPILFSGAKMQWVIENAKVRRYDVAVDMLNVSMQDLIYESSLKGKFMEFYGQDKTLESAYLGKEKKKDGAGKLKYGPLYLYDKKQQIDDTDQSPKYGGTADYVRIECRAAPGTALKTVAASKKQKHLSALKLYCLSTVKSPGKPYIWNLFEDSCRHRGIAGALELIPESQRQKYLDRLNESGKEIWRPQELWKYWPDHLKSLGLLG
jgi:hypothetical protein